MKSRLMGLSIGLSIPILILLSFAVFVNLQQLDTKLNIVTDNSVQIMSETNTLTNTLLKANNILLDFIIENKSEKQSELKVEFEQVNDHFTETLSSLRGIVTEAEFQDNLDKIKEQHFNFMSHSEELMQIHSKKKRQTNSPNDSVGKTEDLETFIDFDTKRALIEIDEINDMAYALGTGLDEDIADSISMIKWIVSTATFFSIVMILITLFYPRFLYKTSVKSILFDWDKIVKLKGEVDGSDQPQLKKLKAGIEQMDSTISALRLQGNSTIKPDNLNLDYDHKQIYEFIRHQSYSGKSISFKDIKTQFNITFPTVQKRIKYLEEQNLVRVEKSGRKKLVFLLKSH